MNSIETEKIKKLKQMRKLATGLLILMAAIYLALKRYADSSFIVSCIVAFAEASMVGALADWFAVVALFRHPLGFRWIPHTAIIQQNQGRIGDSLASFVVDNFFTETVLRGKLAEIDVVGSIIVYVKKNSINISTQIANHVPDIMQYLLNNAKVTDAINNGIVGILKKTEVSPYLQSLLTYSISNNMHVPLVKQIIRGLYNYVDNNKDETMSLLEGLNKALALPLIGDLAYKTILKTLFSLQTDIDNEQVQSPLVNEIINNLPQKLIKKFNESEELHEKIELKKDEFIDSEGFAFFIKEKIDIVGNEISNYSLCSKDELIIKISGYIDKLSEEIQENHQIKDSTEVWIEDTVIHLVGEYGEEIGKLISDTVKEWPMKDMVDKLEIQVGGDLQYIRINGTVIGGLAGLAIHLLSYLF